MDRRSMKVCLFLYWLTTCQAGSKMMRMPDQVMQANEVQEFISQENPSRSSQRQNRDTSEYLDDNLEPLPLSEVQQAVDLRQGGADLDLPPGIVPPADIPEGFDPASLEAQDDGQFCVYKTIPVEGIEKIPVQKCVHRVDTQCYFSYSTQYTPSTEDICTENYKKKCYIEYTKTSVTETIEKCYHPMERVCSPPKYGEVPNEVCQTQYETTCVTKYKDTPVVEDVEECNKVYKKVCEYVKEGYGKKRVCNNKPVNECGTVSKTVYKKLPDTTCERIPFEACAPDNCEFVPGEPVCHNKTVDIGIDSPEEVCDLQPQKMCKQVYRLVPKLTPTEVCDEVPREVCYTTLKNPRKVSTPLLTKWCFKPEEEKEEPVQEYGAPPPHYPQPPQYSPLPAPAYPPPPPPAYIAQPPPPPAYPQQPPPPPSYSAPVTPPAYPPPAYPPPANNYGNLFTQQAPKRYGFKLVEPSLPPFQPPQDNAEFNFPQDFASQGLSSPSNTLSPQDQFRSRGV